MSWIRATTVKISIVIQSWTKKLKIVVVNTFQLLISFEGSTAPVARDNNIWKASIGCQMIGESAVGLSWSEEGGMH